MSSVHNVTVSWRGRPCAVSLDVATFGHPGRFDPYDGGDPPEGPEGEVLSAAFVDGEQPEPLDVAGLGDDDALALLDLALTAAAEQRDAGDVEPEWPE